MTPPKRQLGLIVAAAIVVASMIGAGVFTGAGFQAARVMYSGGLVDLCGVGSSTRMRSR